MTPMLDALDDYYRKMGIHSMDFRCCRQGECKSEVPAGRWFTEAKSAFVGKRYEDGIRPRLLFLGSDPGEGKSWQCSEQRSPAAIRKKVECDVPSATGITEHWWGTLRFALRILSGFDAKILDLWNENQKDSPDCRLWGPKVLNRQPMAFRDLVTPCLAHANAVRCSVNAKRNEEADDILFKNCRQYLCGEMEVLEPDIIVTQSGKAKEALDPCVRVIRNGSECQCQGECKPPLGTRSCSETCKVVRLGNREALWIHTYHPSYRKRLFMKEGGPSWNCYAAAAERFMSPPPGLV
jgi:hypothetical protein